ncbi:PREDICTED: putative F-box/kelch-repeat protein At1g13200 [Camelina sativa]|uniref:F-box/kelch-repeat protein At1g13200 n=1 Tax=Camelina sativa TaxID=90675 RepID=A0ABM0Y3Z8_CAMSA|nr:PREDICTED: putative F-box/kelch-repeat protein At1g13200 [Camelina sativa]
MVDLLEINIPEKRVEMASSSQRKRRRRRIRKRRRRNEKRVKAPSSLPNDVLEEIFLRFPVKAIIRLKSLSKQWRSTIESRSFEERHLKIAKQACIDHPKVMIVTEEDPLRGPGLRPDTDIGFRLFCLESASLLSFTRINFSPGFLHRNQISESCDGLFCIHSPKSHSIYVVNPATRWFRQLPPARFQILNHKFNYLTDREWNREVQSVAFVKATDYKLVWLYNSGKYNDDPSSPNKGVTKCEVFDFRANAWRYLAFTPSHRIYHDQKPAYANGSVYWFTEPDNARIEVVALDIHTETFRLLSKINPAIAGSDPHHIDMCTLDNSLCMSKREDVTMIQEIWRLKPSEDTWEKIFTIDLLSCPSSRVESRDLFKWSQKDMVEPSTPVAVCKNKKLLLSHRYSRGLVKYDPLTKSLDFFFRHPWSKRKVTYFQSLISHL